MKAYERREALLGWLRGRQSGTAAQAASHFQTTERTILRDIAHLRDHGEPISSSSGPGGGFHLERSARLRAVRLTIEEVVGLALAAGIARQTATGLPFSVDADHAIDRLIRTLPHDVAAQFKHLMQRVVVGQPASVQMNATMDQVEHGLLDAVETAFSANRILCFDYIDRHGQTTSRTVEAHGLLVRMPIWYVVAHDTLRDAPRMFRVDRMQDVVLLKETFKPRPTSWFVEYMDPRYWEASKSQL